MPLWPYGWKVRGLASTAAFGLVKASRRSLVISGGSGLPLHFCNAGLGSNRSSWLGPPSMNMKITFLALAGKVRLAWARAGSRRPRAAALAFHQLRQRGDADAARALLERSCGGSEFCGTLRGP